MPPIARVASFEYELPLIGLSADEKRRSMRKTVLLAEELKAAHSDPFVDGTPPPRYDGPRPSSRALSRPVSQWSAATTPSNSCLADTGSFSSPLTKDGQQRLSDTEDDADDDETDGAVYLKGWKLALVILALCLGVLLLALGMFLSYFAFYNLVG